MSGLVHTTTVPGTTGTCTYGTFDQAVGEPRGVEHTVYRVPDWFIQVLLVYTAV